MRPLCPWNAGNNGSSLFRSHRLLLFDLFISSWQQEDRFRAKLILPMEESEGGKKGVSIDLNDCFLNEIFARCVLFNWKFEVRKNVKFQRVI